MIRWASGAVGWDHCVAVFGDARAVGGWAMVGVEMQRPPAKVERTIVRPCPPCGFRTTSISDYLCAACHFDGWWGRWRRIDEDKGAPAA